MSVTSARAKLPKAGFSPEDDRIFVLILGAPRSGTTLLAAMLGGHGEAAVADEDISTRWMRSLLGKRVLGNKLCIPNQIRLRGDSGWKRRASRLLGAFRTKRISDTSIEDYLAVESLKLVAVLRPSDQVIKSAIERSGIGQPKAARRWVTAVETLCALKAKDPQRLLLMEFADLVSDPAGEAQRLCRFLGIATDSRMLDAHRYNTRYGLSSIDHSKAKRNSEFSLSSAAEAVCSVAQPAYEQLCRDAQAQRRASVPSSTGEK